MFGAAALLIMTAAPAFALEDGKLLIRVGANRDEAAMAAIGARFEADLGVQVTVQVVDPDLTDKFQQGRRLQRRARYHEVGA